MDDETPDAGAVDIEQVALESLPPEFRALMGTQDAAQEPAKAQDEELGEAKGDEEPESDAVAEPVATADPEETPENAPAQAPDAIAAAIKEQFGVDDPLAFLKDLAEAKNQLAEQQERQSFESLLAQRTAPALAEIREFVENGEISEPMAQQQFNALWRAEEATLRLEQMEARLASAERERVVDRIQSEFPGVPVDTLRTLQAAGVPADAIRKVAADFSKVAEGARKSAAATYTQTRQAVNQTANAHRPATGRAADPVNQELSWEDVERMSYADLLGQ